MSRRQFPAVDRGELSYDKVARRISTTLALTIDQPHRQLTTDVEIVVPVFNEAQDLATSISLLHGYLERNFPLTWLITVVDNASTDDTWAIACRLAGELDGVRAVHLAQKGRGRALRAAWSQSEATVVSYMDVDLSTDLDALLPLVAPLISGHSDVAIGSRLARGARVVRGPKREVISRIYNLLLKATLHSSFSDAQCGFKAMRAGVARQLLPLVEDNAWFFDTELLVLAERSGLRVHEVAVDWVDDPGSTVDIVRTALDDLKGITRMMRSPARRPGEIVRPPRDAAAGHRPTPSSAGELIHFAGTGAVSTMGFALLFALLYGALGAFGADIVALAVCALGNFFANRRFTFATRGPDGRRPDYAAGLLLSMLPLAGTLGALILTSSARVASLPVDIIVLTAVNLCSTLVRFHFLRRVVTTVR
jgi:putative flippase GtrA